MAHQFQEVVTSRQRLRDIIGEPSNRVTSKVIDHIDGICRRFIAATPFIMIATRGSDGLLDQSPKGDPAGFVTVLDDKTLAIPDRLGNKRIDTFENLLTAPDVGILFVIPGYAFTLRVSGKGTLVKDAELQRKLSIDGKEPQLVLIVHVEQAFMHCAKSMARAKIWKPDEWPALTDVPSLAEAMVEHGRLAESRAEMQAIIDRDFTNRMY